MIISDIACRCLVSSDLDRNARETNATWEQISFKIGDIVDEYLRVLVITLAVNGYIL